MFGKADPRDAEIAFLREQVKTLQDKLIALSDIRAAAYLNQASRPHVPQAPAPFRPMGPQAIRERPVRMVDGNLVEETDAEVDRSFKIE